MTTIDKYEPLSGGHRAPLGFAVAGADLRTPIGVGLDANGRLQRGAANTGVIGILVLTKAKNVGAIVDVMQDGELVEVDGLTAGTRYFVDAVTGVVGTDIADVPAGWTVEADRLVVRMGRVTA